jgi:hypothetical protein
VFVFVIAVYLQFRRLVAFRECLPKLADVAVIKPVEGNFAGSYLTVASSGALVFGIINIVGNFGTEPFHVWYWCNSLACLVIYFLWHSFSIISRQNMPLLAVNVTSIPLGDIVTFFGSLINLIILIFG